LIHLDTNVVIALLNNRPALVRERFEAARFETTRSAPMCMSMVVYHELMYGAAASERRQDNEQKLALFIASSGLVILPFEEPDAREAADIRAYLRKTAMLIGPYDVLIAAQARRAGATLVTANGREFNRVRGLVVVDWAV
jgi:tRNA(fMet)-specific endonuclease VapC